MKNLGFKLMVLFFVGSSLGYEVHCDEYCKEVQFLCFTDQLFLKFSKPHAHLDRIKAGEGKKVDRVLQTGKVTRWYCVGMECGCPAYLTPKIGTSCTGEMQPWEIDHYRCKPEGSGGGIDP